MLGILRNRKGNRSDLSHRFMYLRNLDDQKDILYSDYKLFMELIIEMMKENDQVSLWDPEKYIQINFPASSILAWIMSICLSNHELNCWFISAGIRWMDKRRYILTWKSPLPLRRTQTDHIKMGNIENGWLEPDEILSPPHFLIHFLW